MSREIKFRHIKPDGSVEFEQLNREMSSGYVEQYTGLKDKNGKEIYEGDIVAISGERAIVVFDENLSSYMGSFASPVDDNARFNDYIFDFDDIIEVIGNIHENPELLGE